MLDHMTDRDGHLTSHEAQDVALRWQAVPAERAPGPGNPRPGSMPDLCYLVLTGSSPIAPWLRPSLRRAAAFIGRLPEGTTDRSASYILLNLADCFEHLGQAWAEWRRELCSGVTVLI